MISLRNANAIAMSKMSATVLPIQAARNANDGRGLAGCAASRSIADRRTSLIVARSAGGDAGGVGDDSGSINGGGGSGSGSGSGDASEGSDETGVHSPLHRAHRTTRPAVIS